MMTIEASTTPHSHSGRYQPLPSKVMMKLARYSVSGASHSSGTAATFCVRWLVTASSSTEPVADSASHRVTVDLSNLNDASSLATSGSLRGVRHATIAHSSAKAANSQDQALTCWPAARKGSTTKG